KKLFRHYWKLLEHRRLSVSYSSAETITLYVPVIGAQRTIALPPAGGTATPDATSIPPGAYTLIETISNPALQTTRSANVRWLPQEITWRRRTRSSRLPKPAEGNLLRFERCSDYVEAVRARHRMRIEPDLAPSFLTPDPRD